MTHVFHRQINRKLPVAVRGEGIYVIDSTGKRYIDGYSGGASVSCLGHSHPAVVEAVCKQIGQLPYLHGTMFTTEPMEELAEIIAKSAPNGLAHVFFTSSGSEAVETAIMMGRQYFVEAGQPQRRRVISRRSSYHGATLSSMATGHAVKRRDPFEPMLMDVVHISPCYAYRGQNPDETEEEYGLRVADELETTILGLGAETVMAFIAETVVGTTSGAVPPVPGYFRRIREICDRYGVLLILDEVFCGMGRTGTLYACTQEGVAPDLLTMAKGLGAGYQPIGAVLVSSQVFDVIRDGSGAFKGGFTYSGHATACAGAIAVQQVIRKERLVENVARQGQVLRAALIKRFGDHPHIGDIRGRGLMQTIELVADRTSKKPFDTSLKLHERIWTEAMRCGLMCCPGNGTADGWRGDHVVLAPPYIIKKTEVAEIVNRLGEAVDAALAEFSQTKFVGHG